MNGEIFKFFGEVGLKTEEAEKGLKDITGSAESTGSNLVGIFKKAAIAIGAIFTAGKIIDFGKMAVEAAASAQAIEAQFEQVFGSLQGEANAMIDGMATEFGMLPNRILPSFTQLTSMFKGVGMEATHAMSVAEQVTTSAADAAAFYDVSMESAQASLTSFIKGNYQAGEAVGVFATDAQLAQFAIDQGIVDSTASWRDLDEATKMATRADYITNMQEMSGATGQAARESEEFENVMGNLRQAWQDFLSVVGGPILNAVIPVIQGITKGIVWLSEAIKPVTENLGEWVDSLDAVKKLSSIFKNIQKWFKDIGKELKGINKDFNLTEMLDEVKDFVEKAKGFIDNFVNGVANFFQPVVDGFLRHTEIIRDYAGDMFEVILQLFNGDWSGAWDTFKDDLLNYIEENGIEKEE